MKQAIWNGVVLAESDDIVTVENNAYFPKDSVKMEYFTDSETTSYCGWKGDCSYYNVVVEGAENPDAAWYYAEPYDAAKEIKDRIAFWKGVEIKDV